MDPQLQERILQVANAYALEVQQWIGQLIPRACQMSHDRLHQFIALKAPAFVIECEVNNLRNKIAMMQRTRLGATVH
jgi:hypothetical protein